MADLEIHNLKIRFPSQTSWVTAVDSLSFRIESGRSLCLIGESGCGKSVTSMAILRLLGKNAQIEGKIIFDGQDLLQLDADQIQRTRGSQIAMIFQEPMTALNPLFSVGKQIQEVFSTHQKKDFRTSRNLAIEIMDAVGIPDSEDRYNAYPHELSGGLRQRVVIAMALACKPKLLIADEPTTALDVTIQAQILALIKGLQKDFGMTLLLVTHDFGVVAETADDVAVMYAGRIVEKGPVLTIFDSPRHPYTVALQQSIPAYAQARQRLYSIPGMVPSLHHLPPGCYFHDRCSYATSECTQIAPALEKTISSHWVACYHPVDKNQERAQ